jgi:Haem-binding uptake, Tiki superfamily, ChaN
VKPRIVLSSLMIGLLTPLTGFDSTLGQDQGSSGQISLLQAGGSDTQGSPPVTNSPDVRPNVHLPDETAGLDQIVRTLLSVFDHADIVALGENHWRKWDSDLRIQLVRHPDFAKKVQFIVVEFGSTAFQATLDRYMQGEEVPLADLQQVWRNTTQTNGVWESPVYAEFFAAVREINRKLPADKRVRVVAGDPPPGEDRDLSAASILKEQVLDKRGKALLVYGSAHLYRAGDGIGGITKALQATHPGRIFVVDMMGGTLPEYQKFEDALKSSARPVLVSLGRMPFRDFSAEEFLGGTLKKKVNGVWVPAPTFRGLTLGQEADACVYLGMSPDVERRVTP